MRLSGMCPVLLPFFLLILLSSCNEENVSRVDREKLFTLSYGRFEDEIDLFQLDANSTGPDTQIYMRDGMFYISNSGSKKILQLTSFGDLLSVYYNPETNPVPSFTNSSSGSTAAAGEVSSAPTTRKAVSYPFNHPVYLTVDSLKRLFVVDQVPADRVEFDNDDQVVLRDVVLRFNPDGRFIDYIGQEGPGGTPFPPITGVYSNNANETIVTVKTQVGIKVYWFDSEGALLFRIPVEFKNLPSPYEKDKNVLSSLEKILPDPASRRIYLKIDYYAEVIDAATKSNAGISFDRSCLYPFDISSGKYEHFIDVPAYEGVDKDNLGTVSFKKPYELLGITTTGWVYLYTPGDDGYALEVLDSRSRRIYKRNLAVQPDELAYNVLMLSPDGIVSALLASSSSASLVWWRTDALIGEIRR
jgi:hypothetical protein